MTTAAREHLDPQPEPVPSRCAFCGCADAGHRLRDTLAERVAAGESVEDVARDHHVPAEQVREAVARRASVTVPDAPLSSWPDGRGLAR